MSQENVEIVRRLIGAARSGPADATSEVVVGLGDPKVEFRSRLTAVEGATYRGHDGVRSYFRDLNDTFAEWRNESDDIVEMDDDLVLAKSCFHGIGKDSGAEVELPTAVIVALSNGKVMHVHSRATRREALEAAGLSE